ncbi:hypothetical protein JCM3774_006792 [Rhodotorula dairenensis]
MPGLRSSEPDNLNKAAAAGKASAAEKANLGGSNPTEADCTLPARPSTPATSAALSPEVPEIVVTPPELAWPSSDEGGGGLMLDFSCQGWPSNGEGSYGKAAPDADECAAILDRLSVSPAYRLKSTQRRMAPDLVLRAARRELLLQEIDAWSRIADERLTQWLRGSPPSAAESTEIASRAAVKHQTRKRDVELRTWVLHRAVGARHALCSSTELGGRPPWALLV